ncbi:MAG: RsmB/NOP family class I SAM-dependent RNA methyltransferase [Nanoarchaeota archaeon]|nr:RsmB/NOP family class I SAM-dependent RNA methyltransferase [Nanoarchaeota archaeon]
MARLDASTLKPLFVERMQELLGEDFENYINAIENEPPRSIRCNTLKISPDELVKRLESKGWKIKQPFKKFLEIMIIEGKISGDKVIDLGPGELGRSIEHVLGYYYVQEVASMLPVIALNLKPGEMVLDLCAAPGSKTTQSASYMENTGTIIANEVSLGRIKILASNTERCGVVNIIITKQDGAVLCRKLKKLGYAFDKILIDAPCSGEGTLRSTPKTAKMWNINTVRKLSGVQKNLLSSALEILKVGGEIVYSTCTHAPEENEGVVSFILDNYMGKVNLERLSLPVKCREGIASWKDREYNVAVKNSCRVYPQDDNTEGFFIAKFKKLED